MVYFFVEGGIFIFEFFLGYCNGGDKWLYFGYDYIIIFLIFDLL